MNRLKHTVFFFICLLSTATAMAQLTVNCQGAGLRVYLIGGGPAFTTWNLEPIQKQLRSDYEVCRWDMRGVGENANQTVRQDIPVLTQWLQDMAEVLPEEPVVLWGHSWGALQSLLFARHYPDRVRALILNNPVDPELASMKNIEAKRYVHPYVESHLRIEDIDTPAEQRHRFRSKIASYFMDAKTGWAYSAQFNRDDTNNKLNVQIWQEYRKVSLDQNDLKLLAPKLSSFIYCKHDVLMPENFEEYSRAIPSGRHYIINDCAHFPWVESPVEFYEILRQNIKHAQQ